MCKLNSPSASHWQLILAEHPDFAKVHTQKLVDEIFQGGFSRYTMKYLDQQFMKDKDTGFDSIEDLQLWMITHLSMRRHRIPLQFISAKVDDVRRETLEALDLKMDEIQLTEKPEILSFHRDQVKIHIGTDCLPHSPEMLEAKEQ